MKAQKPLAEITIEAGDHIRINTPVQMHIRNISFKPDVSYILMEIPGNRIIPCQIQPVEEHILFFTLRDTLFPGQQRSYQLFRMEQEPQDLIVSELDGQALTIYCNKQPVLQYYYATKYPPEGIDTVYKRSGFIHPLWSPGGHILTRIQPPDHYHHYGIWNPWSKTLYEGRTIDFWNLNKNEGTVVHKTFKWIESGPVYGGFQAHLYHVDKTAPGGSKTALIEKLQVGAWVVSDSANHVWLIDYISELQCGTNSSITLEHYPYAGFGFRARESWTNQNSYILTSEGHHRRTANGSRGKWCLVYGETDLGISGILFMGHPENRDFPEPMRIWPEDANGGRGDVFFNFCPVKENDWELTPGRVYMLRYRMLVYEGTLSTETAERLWHDFANPPKIEVHYFTTE